ncbi:MAG: hypothetical protein OXL41_03905 [Nitrospinae bacterium]|nr:hypothetical protein [Nitrospinota bacterium]
MTEQPASTSASVLRGTKTLLIGEPGSGKTTSLATFVEAGLKHNIDPHLCVLVTDPEGEESLIQAFAERNLPRERLHLRYIPPAEDNFSALIASAKMVGKLSYKDLTEMKAVDKAKYTRYIEMLEAMADFVDQDTGESLGPVDKFPGNWMFAMDSLTGVNYLAMKLTIAGKPVAHQGEWGVAMNLEENLILTLVSTLQCFVCLTGHIDKEMDEVIGRPQYMAGLLGRKLAPKIPRLFSDSLLAFRENGKFRWTADKRDYSNLKARNTPLTGDFAPSFEPMVVNRIQSDDTGSA